MLKSENLCMSFNNTRILNGINIEINDSDFVVITGESGSGKSTLLSILSTLEKPTSGEVFYDDRPIYKLNEKEISLIRKDSIGIIFQRFYLESEYTVYENVILPLQFDKKKKDDMISRAFDVMKKCNILDKKDDKAKFLSGGEMQRVAIARALINNPKYIFADEPCGNLDSKNGFLIMELFKKLHKEGKTIILVTHNKEHIRYGNKVIELKDGEIINK